MKIECSQEKLLSVLLPSSRVAGKKLALPVLSAVLLEGKNGTLVAKATNLDLGIEVTIPARVSGQGSVAIPSDILTLFVSNVRQGSQIVLEASEQTLSVTTPHSKTIIKTQNKDDFPTIPKVSSEDVFTMEASDLVKGLKAVWQSASVSNMKPELSSVYMYSEDSVVVFVATDSFRLAEKRITLKKGKKFPPLLIPFKNVVEIIRILEHFSGEVEMHMSSNQVALVFDNVYVTSRTIEGTFPDYKEIIPKNYTTEVVVLRQDIINTLKTAHLFSDTFHQVKLSIDPKRKKCSVITRNTEVGENTEEISAAIEGDQIEMGFNYKYIADALPSFETDSIILSFNGMSKPLVMRGVGDRSFTYLVMPMNK